MDPRGVAGTSASFHSAVTGNTGCCTCASDASLSVIAGAGYCGARAGRRTKKSCERGGPDDAMVITVACCGQGQQGQQGREER